MRADDAPDARALVTRTLRGTPYETRALELLEEALDGSEETLVLGAGEGGLQALALFGPVAGSVAWSIDALLFTTDAPVRELGTALLDGIAARARDAGQSLLVAELPADAVIGRALTLLRKSGFRQVGRIPDFYRDGVALLFLRRDA